MKRVVAIDLGSNSIRALKLDCESGDFLGNFHKTVKTADGLATTGLISEGAVNRVIDAIREADKQLNFSDSKLMAVTTEAMRQALNSEEVLEKIWSETGVKFEIIDGNREAEYALTATKMRLNKLGIKPKSFLLADIGGASTELIFHYGDKTVTKSFKVGIVTLTQSFQTLPQIAQAVPILMRDMKRFIDEVYSQYGKVEKFVAIAGTPTTIASMKLGLTYKTYDAEKVQGTVLTRKDLVTQLERLLTMPKEERMECVGVGREDLIASGVLIFEEIFNLTQFYEVTVLDDGIREGLAFHACEKFFEE